MIAHPTMFAKVRRTKVKRASRTRFLAEAMAALDADEELRPEPPARQKEIAKQVMQVVCDYFAVTMDQLVGNRGPESISWPRQVAMVLVCDTCNKMSLGDIGRIFGGRGHTTVSHAIRRVTDRIQTEPNEARREVAWIRSKTNQLKGLIDGDGI